MRLNEVNGAGDFSNYTPVTVKDKDSGKSFVINFANAKIKGNEAEWTIKDGKVYDKNGKTVEDNLLEVTRYQAAIIQAAAEGDGEGDKYLDSNDIIGAAFAEKVETALQEAKSEYHVDMNEKYSPARPEADAFEYGVFYAGLENAEGDKKTFSIELLQNKPPEEDKKWYQFWK